MGNVSLLSLIDAAGTFAFALSGAALAVQKRFDVFGVLFLAFVTAVTGGVARDVLIGAVPPEAISHWRAFAIALAGGFVTIVGYRLVSALQRPVLVLDAIGLGLFAVTGAQKALIYGIDPPMAAVLGMVTGIGGGMMRDVLAGEVPSVLRTDIYAVAALAAGAIVALGDVVGVAPAWSMPAGAALCIFLRMMAIFFGWHR
ncbi:MAG: trimeric intracellular cation channel family protein [Proteobacteria bacterium]|nr:trimeric intracellular cation channel family protein [Pseudomonadota bacterium]